MHYQSVKRKLPEPDVEVIGFNKEWCTSDNIDGTRICMLDSSEWVVTIKHLGLLEHSDIRYTLSHSYAPTHWCSKPIPPITLK